MLKAMLLVIAMAGCAEAGTPLKPPKEYDYPFNGVIKLIKVNRDNVWEECSHSGKYRMRRDVAGCARVEGNTCIIHIAMLTKRAHVYDIFRHEQAHCNGWKH